MTRRLPLFGLVLTCLLLVVEISVALQGHQQKLWAFVSTTRTSNNRPRTSTSLGPSVMPTTRMTTTTTPLQYRWDSSADDDNDDETITTRNHHPNSPESTTLHPSGRRGGIVKLECTNLAGLVPSTSSSDTSSRTATITVPLLSNQDLSNGGGGACSLTAITGDTGAGKSVLVVQALQFLLLQDTPKMRHFQQTQSTHHLSDDDDKDTDQPQLVARVGLDLLLDSTYWSAMESVLSSSSSSQSEPKLHVLTKDKDPSIPNGLVQVHVERTVESIPSTSSSRHGKNHHHTNTRRRRLKSTCTIGSRVVSCKQLTTLLQPLLVVVDTPTAIATVFGTNRSGNHKSTSVLSHDHVKTLLTILDTAVNGQILQQVEQCRSTYYSRRQTRQGLEQELQNRVLPSSFQGNDENDMELMNHWITELHAFGQRVDDFCAVLEPAQSLEEEEEIATAPLSSLVQQLAASSWKQAGKSSSQEESSLYQRLLSFRSALQSIQNQLTAVQAASDILGSLSLEHSARVAVDQARNHLYHAARGGGGGGGTTNRFTRTTRHDELSPTDVAAERAHDLLNVVEEALLECTTFLDDESNGLVKTLVDQLNACGGITLEQVDALLGEWSTMARKHGLSSYDSLPSCHASLIAERDGNVEARELLPKAKEEEKEALEDFEKACHRLSEERQRVAEYLQAAVTERMPSLGMEHSTFQVHVHDDARSCKDMAACGPSAGCTGVDSVEFVLTHSTSALQPTNSSTPGVAKKARSGNVGEVASSGEKARLLLAIECALPGSIGVSSSNAGKASSKSAANKDSIASWSNGLMPITVVYDEIDAHVGGHAAVAVARMLADQSKSCQVVSITHNPAVASIADTHVVVQKGSAAIADEGHRIGQAVAVKQVSGQDRKREIARMASGDLATDEAVVFADALLREGQKYKP